MDGSWKLEVGTARKGEISPCDQRWTVDSWTRTLHFCFCASNNEHGDPKRADLGIRLVNFFPKRKHCEGHLRLIIPHIHVVSMFAQVGHDDAVF